jgi:hypothetical protein
MICPRCGRSIDSTEITWPVTLEDGCGEIILDGGCQECWEAECSESWWQMAERIGV